MKDLKRSELPEDLATSVGATERVRSVPGYAGLYFVTSDGRLWSAASNGWIGTGTDGHGYPKARLYRRGKSKQRRVHELVLAAFEGPRPRGELVLHKNDQPADNRLSNLNYGTAGDNLRDAYRNRRRGKLTGQAVKLARVLHKCAGKSFEALGAALGVDPTTIARAVRGETWSTV